MANPASCPTCEGFGKVASDNGRSWLQFKGKPYHSPELAGVREGSVGPRLCPDCKGTGVKPEEAPQEAAPAPAAVAPKPAAAPKS